jgi:P-aminobenzoate N-oxygenase AurF
VRGSGESKLKSFEQIVERLCEASRNDFANPYLLEWPDEYDSHQWYMSAELLSLYPTPFYEQLSEDQKKRLSFLEAVNFFSLNIHGEKSLIEGLAKQLYGKRSPVFYDYLHHFLDEENKHMVYFGGFCMRYAGKVYPDKKLSIEREYAPVEEEFLFFAKVLIFEEIVDVYNVQMSQDERLAPIAREINRLHHRDEARHLVFGRRIVKELFDDGFGQWEPSVLNRVRSYLAEYLTATWREYYNPEVYRDLGMNEPYNVYEKAFENEASQNHRKNISAGCIEYFLSNEILSAAPEL